MLRLVPSPPQPVEAAEVAAAVRPAPAERPWVMLNMVTSLDGATAVAGRSGGLGGPGDRALFGALRRLADVVLVGAGTARAEHYRPPKRPGQRIALVTRQMDLEGLDELLASGQALVVTSEAAPSAPAGVAQVRAGATEVDLADALAQLRAQGVELVLCEGGPSLNAALLAAGLVDELCLTLAPFAVSGTSARLAHATAALEPPLAFRLAQVVADGDELLLRYVAG